MTKANSKRGKRNRRNGQVFEREVVQLFKELGHMDARRNLQSQGGRKVGNDIAEVPFNVECKHTSSVSLIPKAVKALEQCERDAKGELPCIVVTKRGSIDASKNSLVVMRWETFREIVK